MDAFLRNHRRMLRIGSPLPKATKVLPGPDPARVAERKARARQDERDELLTLAANAIVKGDRRNPAKVLAVAEPLLAWLDEATSDLDRAARRTALGKVAGSMWGNREDTPAAELIERAAMYYRFIAA